ncbi:MAG: ParB N-terminal domain-containing protein [Hydrogeniiclostridium mannosilyticum]
MNIIQLPLGEIHPYKNNPRKNEGAVDAVAESIKQYGFLVPLVISADGAAEKRKRAAGG